jgi:hypothetical protein
MIARTIRRTSSAFSVAAMIAIAGLALPSVSWAQDL